jgi:integrase/recombinase XerD
MSLQRQAKILSIQQERAVLLFIEQSRQPLRNKVIFLLSTKAGLRAKEIANLEWGMCTDPEGDISSFILLEDKAAKGKSGREIPLNKDLKKALAELYEKSSKTMHYPVIRSERGGKLSAQSMVNFFYTLYRALGFSGCSSHSGRRTFVTRLAKNIVHAGGSLRDVQRLAGHTNLQSTQRYIEHDSEAARKVVDLI